MKFKSMLETVERLSEELENMPQATTDTETLVRIYLADALALARKLLRCLAADES